MTLLNSDGRSNFLVALIWAFYYLKNEWSYKDALKDVLMGGGDFITNASIVGGLIGAAQGQQAIYKKNVVLSFDPAIHRGKWRPGYLLPKNDLIQKLDRVIKYNPISL